MIPTLGRIVHYTGERGVEYAAIIHRVRAKQDLPIGAAGETGFVVSLAVFYDGWLGWIVAAPYAADPTPEHWHWPPRVA